MSGTGRSDARLPGIDLAGRRSLLVVVAAQLVMTWSFVALLGSFGWFGLLSVAATLGQRWSLLVDGPARTEQLIIRTALRDHADPGPEFRAAVDGAATRRLAASAVDRWGPPVLCVVPAIACAVVAGWRDDLAVALPVLPLLVLAAVLDAARRREEALADRWLAAPPVPTEDFS
ncbi:hypothetical protein [Blastococcus atacamensis]|uniref:hypothetical protein n=1 Tax=Blastococcus atacamensis TaxID=2070508 RepID=UPI0012FFEF18|nr:hypothetical protein [Blastococcus atacamensis]